MALNASIVWIALFFSAAAAGALIVGRRFCRFAALPETAGGAAIALIFFSMLPEALCLAGGLVVFPALALGMILAVFLKDILKHTAFLAGSLAAIGLPVGMALAGGVIAGAAPSVKFTLCVFALYLPWGAAMRADRRTALLASLPVLAGALLGLGAAHLSYRLIGTLLAVGCGVMVHAALRLPRTHTGYGGMAGILIGFAVSIL